MADIFLSYKREDRDKVRPLVEALQAQGWSVWWDTRIGAGETWDQVIEAELSAAKCVVVAWSKRSIESDWVRAEAHNGRERRCLIPIILEGVTPPSIFKMIQATDLSDWKGDRDDPNFAYVCAGIARLLKRGEPAITTPPQPVDRNSSPLVAPPPIEKAPIASVPAPTKRPERPGIDPRVWIVAAAAAILLVGGVSVYWVTKRGMDSGASASLPKELPDALQAPAAGLPEPAPGPSTPVAPKLADNDAIIEAQTKIIDRDPRNYAAFLDRGGAYLNKYDLDKAIGDFDRAADINPKGAEAFLRRGFAYRKKNETKRAIADYTKAINLNPDYSEAYSYRGYANYGEQDYDLAVADFKKAIDLNPKYAEAYAGRAIAYHGRGDYDAAINDYTKAIELEPKNAKRYNGRGVAYHDRAYKRTKATGDYAAAIKDYDKAIELEPNYPIAYKNRGFTYRVTNDLEGAIRDYTKAIEFNPRLAEAYNARGYAYEVRAKTGDRALAEADYKKAIEIQPSYETAKRNLKDLRGKK